MDNLSTYLKDHLAGSVAALNMIDHLIDTYEEKPLAQFFRDLRGEIAADQAKLQWLVEKLDKKHNAIRRAGAWIAEKLSRVMRCNQHIPWFPTDSALSTELQNARCGGRFVTRM